MFQSARAVFGCSFSQTFSYNTFFGFVLFSCRRFYSCCCCVQNDMALGTLTPIISLSMNVMWLVAYKPMHFVFRLAFCYYLLYTSPIFPMVFLSICRCVCKHRNVGKNTGTIAHRTHIKSKYTEQNRKSFFSDTINNVSYTLHRGNEQSPNKKIS